MPLSLSTCGKFPHQRRAKMPGCARRDGRNVWGRCDKFSASVSSGSIWGKPKAKVTIRNCNLIKETVMQKCKKEIQPHDFSQLPSVVGSVVVDASGQHMLAGLKSCLAVCLIQPMCFSLSLSLCFPLSFWHAVKKKKKVFICFDWLRTRRSSSLIQFFKTRGTTDRRTIPNNIFLMA